MGPEVIGGLSSGVEGMEGLEGWMDPPKPFGKVDLPAKLVPLHTFHTLHTLHKNIHTLHTIQYNINKQRMGYAK